MKSQKFLFLFILSLLFNSCGPHQEKDILSYCEGQTETDFQFGNLTYVLISKSTTSCELELIKTQFETKGFTFDFSASEFSSDGTIDYLRLRVMYYYRKPFWNILAGRSFIGGGLDVTKEELLEEDYGFMFYDMLSDRRGVSSGRFKHLLRWAEEREDRPE
ncbi:MAG: hypothetical protein AAGD28_23705 [Bacteroidota bacterium]